MKKLIVLASSAILSLLLLTGCSQADLPEAAKQNYSITRSDASAVALSSIGVTKDDTTYTVVTENLNSAHPCYDVEILVDGVLYRYRVDANKGDLLKITVNDQEVDPKDIPKPISASNSQYVSLEAAKQAAFTDANITEADVIAFEYEMDYAHGKYLYDLEFRTSTHKYEYEIDAIDASLFKKDVDDKTILKPNGNTQDSAEYIIPEAAEAAALAHAGLDRANVLFEKTKWSIKKGTAVYEVDFIASGVEYEYTINALTSAVINLKTEGKADGTVGAYIGEDAAKQASLAHAGLSKDNVTKLFAEPDIKNGKTIYEIEFFADGYEYDYEIDAQTGEILEVEKERD